MMRLFIIILLCIMMSTVQAEILRVAKDGTASYTEVQPAINDASAGDTIVVCPSGSSYIDFTLDKPLVILGAGTDSENGYISVIAGMVVTMPEGSGSTIRSLKIISNQTSSDGYSGSVVRIRSGTQNVRLVDCKIWNIARAALTYVVGVYIGSTATTDIESCSIILSEGWVTYPGYTRCIYIDSADQVTIQSCYLYGHEYAITGGDNTTTITAVHCLFTHCNSGILTDATGRIENSAVVLGSWGAPPNLTFSYSIYADPGEFVAWGIPEGDFHLAPTSCLRDSGNVLSALDRDGTRADIGMYGGPNPFNDGGIPDFPFVTEMSIPPSVSQNGVLHIGSRGRVGQGGGE